jgi:hypothetical protein
MNIMVSFGSHGQECIPKVCVSPNLWQNDQR